MAIQVIDKKHEDGSVIDTIPCEGLDIVIVLHDKSYTNPETLKHKEVHETHTQKMLDILTIFGKSIAGMVIGMLIIFIIHVGRRGGKL